MVTIAEAWTGFTGCPPAPEDTKVHWQRWNEAAAETGDESLQALADAIRGEASAKALFDTVFGGSPYLTRCLIGDADFARTLIEAGPDAAYGVALEGGSTRTDPESEQDLMERLRLAKRRASLAIAMADIAATWPLEKVTGCLSEFAEATLRAACGHLLQGLHDKGDLALPDPRKPESGCGLFVLGMGKFGARELNYSSDIDLIVLFDEDTVPDTGNRGIQQIFTRLAQGLVRIIGSQTAHGYVFRTDLRLRPDPGSTPPAVSVRSADIYYRDSARNWERAAMIKARIVAGDEAAGERFLEGLQPFIWRRHLDFAAMQDIRIIKHQIDASRSVSEDPVKGRNVKLGRGGIREIEFFVQAQQLVWGGRDPGLRTRATCETLDTLVARGHVAHRAATELKAAYRFLRGLEHRLQMVDDQQTHSLPDSDEGMGSIAGFMGYASAADLSEALHVRIDAVERHYATLFRDKLATLETDALVFDGEDHDPETLRSLSAMGYADPERISVTVRAWADGRFPALRNKQPRDRLIRLAPVALAAFASSPDPDAVLLHFNDFLARLPAGNELFSLLEAHPELFGLISEILGSAPLLARSLTRHPILLDSVLSREFADLHLDDEGLEPEMAEAARKGLVRLFYMHEFDRQEMAAQLGEATSRAAGIEDLLDIERRWANDKVFQIGVHLLRGLLSPTEASHPLSGIADVCIGTLVPALEQDFVSEHGRIADGRFAVVAFGKLGSREMTVGSDLDLMFLYDHAADADESDGRKPLSAIHYYARLCRRLISAITAPTAEGKLYDVDMRLRPSGNAGPIACSLEAFDNYQRTDAWTWEHQALTRARTIYAEGDLAERFEAVRNAVLTQPRNRDELARDVIDMRERIRREHGDGGGSIRHMPGGLIDIEFIAQFLQLLHASENPGILAGDALSVFRAAGTLELIDAGAAGELTEATELWRNLQGMMRLTAEDDRITSAAAVPSAGAMAPFGGSLVNDALVDSIRDVAERVARHLDTLVGTPGGKPAC